MLLKILVVSAVAVAVPVSAQQWGGRYAGSGTSPIIVAPDGQFLGNANGNRYDPNSVSNPYGQYGSKYSPNSINNPYSQYGSRYGAYSPNNPYAAQPPILVDPATGYSRPLRRNGF